MGEVHEFKKQEITFDDFWEKYPRKVAKFAAKKAWERIVSRFESGDQECDPEEIFAALIRYRKFLPEDPQFIPHPSTWLNQGRWMDELPEKKYGWERL